MRIGVKLDLDYEKSNAIREVFGSKPVLKNLKGLGIEAIETAVGPSTDLIAFEKHLQKCIESGFICSIHPYTERKNQNPVFFMDTKENQCVDFHEKILKIASATASLQKEKLVINIHSAAATSDVPRHVQLENSILFFAWVKKWCDQNSPEVLPVTELQIAPNPDEPIFRVGDTFDELEIISRESHCGICWDFGHSFLNLLRYRSCDTPSFNLLKMVKHIHCHDVKKDDHHPLLYDNVPWKNYLTNAIEGGFDGTVIIEVPFERYVSEEGIVGLEKSVGKVRTVMQTATK
jgi:sugar phosphate isomerase/epimerase